MEIELVFKIAAIGIIVAVLNQILSKSGRDEYAMLTVLTGIVVIAVMLVPQLDTLYDIMQTIFDM
ncbi:MAG TPA: stage III sporulation protein AC [Candidatus Fimenecus excrementavium]|nr:stage III sporulation protein AC [Candidatus Fimenecus excrementavium]